MKTYNPLFGGPLNEESDIRSYCGVAEYQREREKKGG
jgi:hypothetical protein